VGVYGRARVDDTPGKVLEPVPANEAIDGAWRSRHRRTLAEVLLAAAAGALRTRS
jgi:hypothetical protein